MKSTSFRMQQADNSASLEIPPCDIALVGEPLDERGDAAVALMNRIATRVHTVTFDQAENEVAIDGGAATPNVLDHLVNGSSVTLEATTLGFAELFFAIRTLWDRERAHLHVVYAEPRDYLRTSARNPLTRRSFELTNEVAYFAGLPRATILLDGSRAVRAVLFAGYEGQRLQQLFEQVQIRATDSELVFGVPAFRPGWEMNSFANALPIIEEHGLTNRLRFAGAQNPAAAYSVLLDVRTSYPAARLLIAPVGTKPHGIGAAVFACEQDNVGLVYDFPVRRGGRSSEIANWHYFEITSHEQPAAER